MLIWGGQGGINAAALVPLGDGASYDPKSNLWIALTGTSAPTPRSNASAVWTGSSMLIWGGLGTSGPLGDGASYDPKNNLWTPISSTNAPAPRSGQTSVWDGNQMLLWGGTGTAGPLGDGASY